MIDKNCFLEQETINRKITLGLLVIFLLIFMYMSLVGDENKGCLTPNLISKVKYLETDSVAGGTF